MLGSPRPMRKRLLLLFACIRWSESASTIGISQRQLADTLTPSLYGEEGQNRKNQCSSSLGIAMAFSLVLDVTNQNNNTTTSSNTNTSAAATPSTFESIGLSVNYTVWKETADELEGLYNGTCFMEQQEDSSSCQRGARGPILTFANSVWTQVNRTLSADYVAYITGGDDETNETENGVLRTIDFGDNTAGSIVNDWVNASTNGLIDSIFPDGLSLGNIQFIAINALYFQAAWVKAFDRQMSTMDPFYTSTATTTTNSSDNNNTNRSTAVFMHRVEEHPYAQVTFPLDENAGNTTTTTTTNRSYQIVQLPFLGSDDISMVIVMESSMPTTTRTLIRQDELIETMLPLLQTTAVALALPKFTIQSEYNTNQFREALSDSGVFAVPICIYDDGDNDNTMDTCLTIDEIIHEAVIEVNEDGVTAAAVTALIGRSVPMYPDNPILMQIDRPFQFFLYEATTDLILLEGYVAEAITTNDDDNDVPLNVTKSHDDDDFWEFMFGVTLRNGTSSAIMPMSSAPLSASTLAPLSAPTLVPTAPAMAPKSVPTSVPISSAPTTKAPTKESLVDSTTSGQTMTQPQSSAFSTRHKIVLLSSFLCYYALLPLL